MKLRMIILALVVVIVLPSCSVHVFGGKFSPSEKSVTEVIDKRRIGIEGGASVLNDNFTIGTSISQLKLTKNIIDNEFNSSLKYHPFKIKFKKGNLLKPFVGIGYGFNKISADIERTTTFNCPIGFTCFDYRGTFVSQGSSSSTTSTKREEIESGPFKNIMAGLIYEGKEKNDSAFTAFFKVRYDFDKPSYIQINGIDINSLNGLTFSVGIGYSFDRNIY